MSKVSYVKTKIDGSINGTTRFKDLEIRSKWVDYIFAHMFTDFQRRINGNKNFEKQKSLSSRNINIDLETQVIKIKSKFLLKKSIEYLIYLIQLFTVIFKPNRKIDFKNICILYGVNWSQIKNEDFSLDNLHRFIKTFFFDTKILNESRFILVTDREFPKLKTHKEFITSNYASIALVKYLTWAGKKRLLNSCLKTIACQMMYMFRDRKYSLMNLSVLDQLVLDKAFQELDIKITLVCTQSVLLSPPLAFYYDSDYINSKMGFWYSDNNLAIPHNSQSLKDFSYDFLNVDLLDRIFLWSESYAAVLREHTEAKIDVTDPILINNQSKQSSELLVKKTTETISFFGISPLLDLANHHFNQLQNSIDDLAAFSILIQNETFSKVNFILKVKREFNRNYHYQDYFRTVMSISELRNVEIVTGEEKALEVIRKSSLVVCTPYTSAALIAKHFGIKTVFFTDKNHYQLPVRYEGIDVLIGKDNLYKHLITELFAGR